MEPNTKQETNVEYPQQQATVATDQKSRIRSKKLTSILLIILAILFIGIISYTLGSKNRVLQQRNPISTSVTPTLSALQPTSSQHSYQLFPNYKQLINNHMMLFVSDNSLYLLTAQGVQKIGAFDISKGALNADASSNKKSIAWVNYPDSKSFSVYNIENQKLDIFSIEHLTPPQGTEWAGGFDISFVPNDSSSIIYQKNGLWIKNLLSKSEQKLVDGIGGAHYNKFQYFTVSPNYRYIIASDECNGPCSEKAIAYDVKTNNTNDVTNFVGMQAENGGNVWVDDNIIVSYSFSRAGSPYLYITTLPNGPQTNVENKNIPEASYYDVFVTNDKKIYYIAAPFIYKSSTDNPAIYQLMSDNTSKFIAYIGQNNQYGNKLLTFFGDEAHVSYFENGNLHIINTTNSSDDILISGIQEHYGDVGYKFFK